MKYLQLRRSFRDSKRRKILHDGSSRTDTPLQSVLDFDKAEHEQPDKSPSSVKVLHGGSSSGTDSQLLSILDFEKAEHDKPPSPASVNVEHDKPPSPASVKVDSMPVDNVEWRKLLELLPGGGPYYSGYQPGKAILSKPSLSVEVEVESDRPVWSYSKSALQQYCQKKRAEYRLVRVTNSQVFNYANHLVYHFNFEARLQNPGVAKPSMKLFFAEAMVPYPKPHFITCSRPIKRMDNVTEGCVFCCTRPHGIKIIHPISVALKVDERLTPVEHNPYDKRREMVMSFPGIPPWQLNHGPVVQAYCDIVRSQKEEQNLAKIRVRQLSEAVLVVLRNKKGMDLKLVEGVMYCTFKNNEHTFHHLNFEAKLHQDDGLSPRMYFAELINHGGADRVTVCCVVDPADKVLEKRGFCARRFIIQPELRYMDPKNVIYVDLELGQELYSERSLIIGLPCTFPGSGGFRGY